MGPGIGGLDPETLELGGLDPGTLELGRPADSEEVKAEKLEAPGCLFKFSVCMKPKIKKGNGTA